MTIIPGYDYRVFGIKQTKSEPFADSKGAVIWDGENKKLLLGQFFSLEIAIPFAENIKNLFADQWQIFVDNIALNTSEEIKATEKQIYGYKKKTYLYDKS